MSIFFFNHPHFTNESSKSLNNLHCTRMPLRKKKITSEPQLSVVCEGGNSSKQAPFQPSCDLLQIPGMCQFSLAGCLSLRKHLMFYLAAFIVHVNRLVSGLVFEEEKNCVPSC